MWSYCSVEAAERRFEAHTLKGFFASSPAILKVMVDAAVAVVVSMIVLSSAPLGDISET